LEICVIGNYLGVTWLISRGGEVKLVPLFLLGLAMSIDQKLAALNITLPAVATPAAAYVMYVRSGNTLYVSGHIAKKEGKPWVGQLGRNMTTDEGKQAARSIAIDLMATLKDACGGDLSKVKRIVKLVSLVNSSPDFTEHHLVTNGASELLAEVFGDAGRHARSAFGVAQIPLGACVEIEMVAELS
jgi:enamine deaminase RidA (YjgF/YER057c/UK114 family)